MSTVEIGPEIVAVDLERGWGFRNRLHGGYLLAVVTEAALGATDPAVHPHPVSVQASFAAAPLRAPAEVVVRRVKTGRTFATVHASLQQEGQPKVEAFVTAGRLPGPDEPAQWDGHADPMPALRPPDSCVGGPDYRGVTAAHLADGPAGLDSDMTVRMDPDWAPPPYGPGGRGDFRGWVRCRMADPVLGALVLADALPPVVLDLEKLGGWVPTLQLQVILRRIPPAGWLAARQWGSLLVGGLLDESCTLWDPQGRVIAQAQQLAAYRPPPA
ncbi:MAG TPA: thioesterase family protein [Mycobacteriales bacterium]